MSNELENTDPTLPVIESTIVVQDKPEPNRVNLSRALKLYFKGMSYSEIAREQGVTPQAIWQQLKPFADIVKQPDRITAYRENEAEYLDAISMEISSNLFKKASDKKATVNNLAYAKRQVFDMRRLLRNESTANVNQLTAIVLGSEKLHKQGYAEPVIPDNKQ